MRLFNNNDSFTVVADEVHSEVAQALKPLIDKYNELGYSMRDVQYLIEAAASELTLDKILGNRGN